jgi:uncharacterized protein (TIGR03086 family)
MTTVDARPLHRRALDLTTGLLSGLTPDRLALPTPCAGWDLRALLEHLVGQNHGFAEAVTGPGDAPVAAFAPRPLSADPFADWTASADALTSAFAAGDQERPVLLPEISTERRVPVALVVGIHLLDTVVHGWDVASTLGAPFQPGDELVAATAQIVTLVPTGPEREQPGSAFAPAVPPGPSAGEWDRILAQLGRAPAGQTLGT